MEVAGAVGHPQGDLLPIPTYPNAHKQKARGINPGPSHVWRWRESNPRPSLMIRGFSERSLLVHFSPLVLSQTHH